jgi:hypothetical protein
MGHIAELNCFVDYILKKYDHGSTFAGNNKPRKEKDPIPFRKMMTQKEHDEILALWRSGKMKRPQICEQFKRSDTTVWKISSGLHFLSDNAKTS